MRGGTRTGSSPSRLGGGDRWLSSRPECPHDRQQPAFLRCPACLAGAARSSRRPFAPRRVRVICTRSRRLFPRLPVAGLLFHALGSDAACRVSRRLRLIHRGLGVLSQGSRVSRRTLRRFGHAICDDQAKWRAEIRAEMPMPQPAAGSMPRPFWSRSRHAILYEVRERLRAYLAVQ